MRIGMGLAVVVAIGLMVGRRHVRVDAHGQRRIDVGRRCQALEGLRKLEEPVDAGRSAPVQPLKTASL